MLQAFPAELPGQIFHARNRPGGQQPPLDRRGNRDPHMVPLSRRENPFRRPLVQQAPGIGHLRRVELPGLDVGTVTLGRAHKMHHTLVLQLPQGAQRPVCSHHLFHGNASRIVNVDQIEPFEPEALLAGRHTAHHRVIGIVHTLLQPPDLRGHRTDCRQVGTFPERTADDLLADRASVERGRVDQRRPRFNGRHNRLRRQILVQVTCTAHPVPAPDKQGPQTYNRHLQTRTSQKLRLHRSSPAGICPVSCTTTPLRSRRFARASPVPPVTCVDTRSPCGI